MPDEITNSIDANADAAVEQEAKRLEDDLAQLREERDKFLDLLQRTQADFENYQKRNRRELELERQYAFAPLVRDLLPAIDNLERALSSVKEETPLSQGIRLVHAQLLETLRRHHIQAIDALDKPFDPHLHQAVMQQPAPDKPPNTVLQVLEPGYLYHDRVLRPSKVIVSRTA
jgi:molecular chaperone GrpE